MYNSYRNIHYSPFDQMMTLFTWNDQGERIEIKEKFEPYFYIEDAKGVDGVSIYDTKLKKIPFENSIRRREYENNFKRIFYNIAPEQQFLIDKFLNKNDKEEFSWNPLKIYYLDIEVFSPDEFPSATEAKHPINLISVKDSISKITYAFGLEKEYSNINDLVIYKAFPDERSLLKAFLRFWRRDYPDVVTGWFIDGFDIPYICNRMTRLFNNIKAPNKLSPVDHVYKRDEVAKRMEKYDQIWNIGGITILDYHYLYKVFTQKPRESYTLDYICEAELNEGKLKYDAVSLSKLATDDWHQFVDYNIQDNALVEKLEQKLNYIQLCRFLAYAGLSPLKTAESTVTLITGVAAQEALKNGKIISTFEPPPPQDYAGGFVKDAANGLHKSLLYFDANSLYPNTIVTLNISPETKIGKFVELANDQIKLSLKNQAECQIPKEEFLELVKKENFAISKYNVLFSQNKRGIFSDIVEKFYAQRVAIKKEMKTLKKQYEKTKDPIVQRKIQRLDVEQYTIKIFLNRIYGYFGQPNCPMYDVELAASITLTGQECIKTAAEIVKKYIGDTYKLTYDPIVLSDTDSVCFSIQPILENLGETFLVDDKINKKIYTIADEFKKTIDIGINDFAKNVCNSDHSTYEFKRENISQAGLFIKKKHYILNIREEDDIEKDEFLYKGVEVVKTSMPKKIKPLVKNIVEKVIKLGDVKSVQQALDEAYAIYNTLELEDIATTISLNGYKKYVSLMGPNFKFHPRTPRHVRAAIYYNFFLGELKIQNKYEKMKNGDKIKTFYAQKNKYGIQTIAYIHKFPEEFKEIFIPDKKLMFEKGVYNAVLRVFDAIDWRMHNPLKEEKVNLLAYFGT